MPQIYGKEGVRSILLSKVMKGAVALSSVMLEF